MVSGNVYTTAGILYKAKTVYIQAKDTNGGVIGQGMSSTATGAFAAFHVTTSTWPNGNKTFTLCFTRSGDASPCRTIKCFAGDVAANMTYIDVTIP